MIKAKHPRKKLSLNGVKLKDKQFFQKKITRPKKRRGNQ